MSLQISVVIPTYNSKELVQKCLVSLEQQSASLADFEVIVMDDGSQDGTSEMLNTFQKKTPLNLKSQSISNSGPAMARNAGVQQATADWVAFLDADVLADVNWIKRALELIEQHPDKAGFEGKTTINDRHQITPFTHQTENLNGGRYLTCNLVLRKKFCRFYNKYHYPFREDTDLAFCILDSGYSIQFDAHLQVDHPPLAPSFMRPLKLALRYYYDGLLRRRFPKLYQNHLDVHHFLGMAIPHAKKKIYGLFLVAQILVLIGVLTPAIPSFLLVAFLLFFLTSYGVTCWACFRPVMPQSRTFQDLLRVMLINLAVPWVMYFQLFKGIFFFRKECPFDSEEWLKSL